jgi:hypothetical protein
MTDDPYPGTFADEPQPSVRPPTKVPGVWTQMPLGIKVLVIVLPLIAAAGVVVLAHQSIQSSANLDNGIVTQLVPTDGSNIVQQDAIGIDLASGYTAKLAVNGTPIPQNQLRIVPGLGQYSFTPGKGKVFTAWPAGKSCAVATYWKVKDGPGHANAQHWCFTVV